MEMPCKGGYGVKVFALNAKRAGEWKNIRRLYVEAERASE